MKFNVNQQDLQKSLNYCQGVIEKRSTLPILSNVLLDASNLKLTITATDLDMIFIHSINNVEIIEEGKTTTTSSIMYDIIRKFSSGKKINFSLSDNNNKLIFFPEENFLIISYIIEDVAVILPSSIISTLSISWIKIKSRSVAVIVSFELLTSKSTFDKIGKVLLFSITPWQ